MKRKKSDLRLLAFLLVLPVLMVSCAGQVKKAPPPPAPAAGKPESRLPKAEQEKLAFKAFNNILNLTVDKPRQQILPDLEKAYHDIINNYPDTYIAQESYLHLIEMDLDDFNPRRIDDAMHLYREYEQRYPDFKFGAVIQDKLARFFYENRLWGDLMQIIRPTIANYIKTGKINGPFFLFLYAEDKLNTGDRVEAEKGYKTVIQYFSASTEARLSRGRLEEMKKKK
ncbi:MAG: hypothetical protein M0Z59_03520 [Nitrospiraceae bacterium]|nr:hypothetical protein [Nitrospiraceae bacterium]